MFGQLRRFLRSPKTAAWLLAIVVAFAAVATAVPQRNLATPIELAAWNSANPALASVVGALGLNHAFTSIPFLAIVFLLTLSTGVCAWDRTRSAAALVRLASQSPADAVSRRGGAASLCVLLPGRSPADAIEDARKALSALSLRVESSGEEGVSATSRLWGAWGSAVFHWALVGLFVAAGAGQAFKWEGQIGVPVGHALTDTTESYRGLLRGPFAPQAPTTGRSIAVTELDLEHEVGGAEQGHAPYVRLTDAEGAVAAEGFVFPNRPLRDGLLFLHRGPWGLAVVVAIDDAEGTEVARRNYLFDFKSTGGTGNLTLEEAMPVETGAQLVRFALPLDKAPAGGYVADLPKAPRVAATLVSGSGEASASVLKAGDDVALPAGGLRLRIVDITRYARFSVVHDPGILLVYLFLTVAVVGCAAALFIRPRAVLVAMRPVADGTELDVVVVAKRIDPLFRQRARAAIEELGHREDTV